uniref:HAT C-terminal dimerisation domain-containing protein n=1 Tax=Anguilla anguilla TaxID=7936 RepID=A0A0E9X9S5_ANGAN
MLPREGLLKLKQAADTMVLSTAECERGFSVMNTVVSPLRTQLKVENVSCLMFINIVGPPLEVWK